MSRNSVAIKRVNRRISLSRALEQSTILYAEQRTWMETITLVVRIDHHKKIATDMSSPSAPPNDSCLSAAPIRNFQSLQGTTIGAGADSATIGGTCGGLNIRSPGVWYRTTGTGDPLLASTCSDDTTFDTVVSVYSGPCTSLECVAANDDAPDWNPCLFSDLSSSVSWDTISGQEYLVHVSGFGSNTSGNFTLEVQPPPQPTNDLCSNALFIAGSFEGTTFSATRDTAPACNGQTITSPGVWFRRNGNGARFRAHTCNVLGTTFDTKISVYRGSCNNLECVRANDDAPIAADCGTSTHSSVTWDSVPGVTYYILVHGFLGAAGEFVLGLEEEEVPTSAPSSSPTPLPTSVPTGGPTAVPTKMPTASPTTRPTSIPTASPLANPSSNENVGVIAGSVAGVAAAILLGIAVWILRRRRNTDHQAKNNKQSDSPSDKPRIVSIVADGTSPTPTASPTDTGLTERDRSVIMIPPDAVITPRGLAEPADSDQNSDDDDRSVTV